jgi:hypothetical protein
MILYTIMPQELVYPTRDEEFQKQKMVNVNGVSMLVQDKGAIGYEIIRLLSTDPQHYLHEQYMPGSRIQILTEAAFV